MKWLADENFDNDIVRGLLRRVPGFDITRVQDIGLSGADDADLLEWAARNGRVVLTHDLSTMIPAMRTQPGEDLPRCGDRPCAGLCSDWLGIR